MSRVWQVADAAVSRGERNLFVEHGVLLIGPGSPGPWTPDRSDADFQGSYVRRLATEVQVGDAVVLRTGLSKITAIGLVASDYLFLDQFEDVAGWDIQHARRVRWYQLPDPQVFAGTMFKRVRFSRVDKAEVLDFVERLLAGPPDDWRRASLPDLPQVEAPLAEPPAAVAELVAQAQDLYAGYWGEDFGDLPTEKEFVAHYVIPLLRDLGWPVELIAVEWRNVDVTLFHRLPRLPENVAMVIEAKRVGEAVEAALDQARGYVGSFGIDVPILVTDGLRYRLYESENWEQAVAYANLTNLKIGAEELFRRLTRA